MMKISVIVPTYNEQGTIASCIDSLLKQTISFEIIMVDDGSFDKTFEYASALVAAHPNITSLKQSHRGPGAARNNGARIAKGDILVFVDADMTFDRDFIQLLVAPIQKGIVAGTFTREEYVANWENVWARCWNYNQNLGNSRRLPQNYPQKAPVFRAILTKEFRRVKGYTEGVGWTDDWTLSRKLGYSATATNALCYHTNPESLRDVYEHAHWVGKNEFFTKNLPVVFFNLIRFNPLFSIIIGLYKSIRFFCPQFFLFKIIYSGAIGISLIMVLFGGHKNK